MHVLVYIQTGFDGDSSDKNLARVSKVICIDELRGG